ncbi:MAG: hypothetical protein L3J73_05560, partial [Thermoplasmata archaeon]|nr:hypothetical protein [Thermoplasmata archaeon]
SWTQLHPTVSPPGRYAAMATYDSVDRCVLMFGGEGVVGLNTAGPLSDTWEFNATGWHQIVTASHPAARENGAMGNDIPDHYAVLFGGQDGAVVAKLFTDTWTFHGGTWTQLNLTLSPPVFQAMSMQMDRGDHYLLLFGGANTLTSLPSNQLWKFSGGVWAKITPLGTSAPTARYYPGLSFDAPLNETVMFGGGNGGALYNDTWTYSAGTWALVP